MNTNDILLQWYMRQFVPDPARGYALMNPEGAKNKYVTHKDPLTPELLVKALDAQPRRLNINGVKRAFPISIAVTPTRPDGTACAAIIDVDYGGHGAVTHVLDVCAEHGLWAFAQLSTSQDHDGGHVYLPVMEPIDSAFLHDLGARITHAANVQGDIYPDGTRVLRLPFMTHLRAPGGPRRFPLLLQGGLYIDVATPSLALIELRRQYLSN